MHKEVYGRLEKRTCIAKLLMLSLIILGCSAASSDSIAVKKKVKDTKMKAQNAARNINHIEIPNATTDTTSGSQGGLNSVDILSPSAASGKQYKPSEKLDETKQIDQINNYNKLHKEPPIGDATMDNDGTIKVRIRMMGGMHADGNVSYSKGSEHYDAMMKHLGGMKPGDVKLVPPWPEPKGK